MGDTMKKKILYGIIIILILASFVAFGIELTQLIEDSKPIVSIAEFIYVDESSIGIDSDSDGVGFEGSITIFDSIIQYDTIYDDDSTGDGYKDRRSYYLGDNMVFASWDENADWIYETSMSIVDGMYIDSQMTDENNDGILDTVKYFSNEGEELYSETDLADYEGAVFRGNPYARELSMETLFWVSLPLVFALVLLIILIILLVKNRKASRVASSTISILLCITMIIISVPDLSYASNIYNDDGSVNQEVFESDWVKYSDIDDRIPLEQRSYEASEYGKSENEMSRLYNLMYQNATNQELNRMNYIELVNYKKAVTTTHKKNLIKSTIRLAAFTGYTVNDSIGKGKTFAENILKSGANLVTQLGDVITVTKDFVTDNYKKSFGMLEKLYKYATSDDVVGEILNDMKNDVKNKVSVTIDETIDKAIGSKKIPDYTVNDLKISKGDVEILKNHYTVSRELDNAILQNRKVNSRYEKKIDDIVGKIRLEIKKLDEFRQAEKDRVYYLLSQNPPENVSEDDEELVELLGETGVGGDIEEIDDSWLDDVEVIDDSWFDDIEVIDDDTAENIDLDDRIIGNWYGTSTNVDITILDEFSESEKNALKRYIGAETDFHYEITKVNDKYYYKSADKEAEITIDGDMLFYAFSVDTEVPSVKAICEYVGIINEDGTEMIIDGLINKLPFDVSGKVYYLDVYLKITTSKF